MPPRLKTLQGSQDPILTSFAIGYRNADLIARRVAPVVPSMTESGTLFTFGKEGFRIYNSERALRAEAKKVTWDPSSTTFRCVERALEAQLDYKEIEAAEKYGGDQVLQLERRTNLMPWNALELELEKSVADRIFGAAYYATGNKATLTGNDQWRVSGGGEGSTSTPLNDIETGMAAARADMGVEPNTVVFGYNSWNSFRQHSQVKALLSYNRDKIITEEIAAQLLEVDRVIVGKAIYTTDGATFLDLWGDSVALIYTPSDMEMAEGTTPHTVIIEEMGYPQVMVYNEKKVRSYETTRKDVVKNVNTSYGYLLLDTDA